eukprot:g42059.t1
MPELAVTEEEHYAHMNELLGPEKRGDYCRKIGCKGRMFSTAYTEGCLSWYKRWFGLGGGLCCSSCGRYIPPSDHQRGVCRLPKFLFSRQRPYTLNVTVTINLGVPWSKCDLDANHAQASSTFSHNCSSVFRPIQSKHGQQPGPECRHACCLSEARHEPTRGDLSH